MLSRMTREGSFYVSVAFHKASGEMSPNVFRSAALMALNNERVSSPCSECASMVSFDVL
jgi:hypothetical protein